jgi:hypothetical protein
MIGWWEEGVDFDLEIETNTASQWLAQIVVDAAATYTDMPFELHLNDMAWWGDHWSFWQWGFAAVNHEEGYDWGDPDFNPYYHSPGDFLYNLSPEFTVGNVRIAVASLATLVRPQPPVAVEPLPGVVSASRLQAYPNPFNGRVSFRIETGGGGESGGAEGAAAASAGAASRTARVDVFDLRGRRVATVPVSLQDGVGEITWRAVDEAGRSLGSGVYLARLHTGDGSDGATARIVYAK